MKKSSIPRELYALIACFLLYAGMVYFTIGKHAEMEEKYNILLNLSYNIHFIVISTPVEPAYVCAPVLYVFVQI